MSLRDEVEKFVRENTGESRDESLEIARNALRDFDVSRPLPQAVRDFAPTSSASIVEAGAGFNLPQRQQNADASRPKTIMPVWITVAGVAEEVPLVLD